MDIQNKWISTVRVNADHGRDFHPLTNHMTKLQTKLIACLMISHKNYIKKLHK